MLLYAASIVLLLLLGQAGRATAEQAILPDVPVNLIPGVPGVLEAASSFSELRRYPMPARVLKKLAWTEKSTAFVAYLLRVGWIRSGGTRLLMVVTTEGEYEYFVIRLFNSKGRMTAILLGSRIFPVRITDVNADGKLEISGCDLDRVRLKRDFEDGTVFGGDDYIESPEVSSEDFVAYEIRGNGSAKRTSKSLAERLESSATYTCRCNLRDCLK